MTIFTSLEAALREGFRWVEFVKELELHRVEKDLTRQDGRRVKMLALAQPEEQA